MANILWSFSTTIRNPERIPSFFKTLCELDGCEWNKENQKKFQTLLIKNRFYVPEEKGLSESQIALLNDLTHKLSYEEAKDIFDSKGYNDPAMRGRTSFDPIEKVGLVSLVNGCVKITPVGLKYKEGTLDFGDIFFNALLKQQFPCPLSSDNQEGYDVKPFIATLHLIKRVNSKWNDLGFEPVGISREEFGIFCLSIKRYSDIEDIANKLIDFRQKVRAISGEKNKRTFVDIYTHQYLSEYPDLDKKLKDYRDNMIRCLRLTKFIYIRGNGYYIDLEPRRAVEINSLLKTDDGHSIPFTKEKWIEYIGDINSYKLPWETTQNLIEIQENIIGDINKVRSELGLEAVKCETFKDSNKAKKNISELRAERRRLEAERTKLEYSQVNKAVEVADSFDVKIISHCVANKPSVELERLSALALNVIDDCKLIKPNYPVGDDNQPTFTAPPEVADIECFYEGFNAICEVTMLNSRDQWVNEGQPVMRHLRNFENSSGENENYCLFIAPKIHTDTLNTFWIACKYEYEGKKQKIIPLTITQMQTILNATAKLMESGRKILHHSLKTFFDNCTDVSNIGNSNDWRINIDNQLKIWLQTL